MDKKSYLLAVFAVAGALLLGACASPNPTAPTVINISPTLATTAPAPAGASAATQPVPNSGGVGASGAVTFKVAPGSTANYRVREQLVRLSLPSDAVGKTSAISGQITVQPDGTVDLHNSKFTVDVTNLVSDESRRDGFVSRSILQTAQFPNVVFVPTQISGLSGIPQAGQPVSFQMTGDLTIRDVTKPVTWDVTGTLNTGGVADAQATTSFTFEDFGLSQPQVPVVLSVVDKITLEVSLKLQEVTQ